MSYLVVATVVVAAVGGVAQGNLLYQLTEKSAMPDQREEVGKKMFYKLPMSLTLNVSDRNSIYVS